MPKFASFTVAPSLPTKLASLQELATNLVWCWHPSMIELFRRIDRDLWEEVNHNPVHLLGVVSQDRFDELSSNDGFLNHLDRVMDHYNNYMNGPTWFKKNFVGKKIYSPEGELVSIGVVKGKVADKIPEEESYHYVDGISGSTLTGNGLQNFLKADLQKYKPFFEKIRNKEME